MFRTTWNGEEYGLHGSTEYADHTPDPAKANRYEARLYTSLQAATCVLRMR